ncbi:glutamate synthase subunit beta [Caldithrix abyssi]
MGKPTGFLEYTRKTYSEQPVKERIKHFKEFIILPEEAELKKQAARCMDCGIPFCHSSYGCPVENLIPEWNDLLYRNQWQEAYERLELTNNFPEITGRVCPAPCETACTLSINDSPVTIKQIERAIAERAFAEGWVTPRPPRRLSGKKVAIVGSGPAGLAAAQQLRRAGHEVTVYEKAPKMGGLLRYGIPDFKLEKHILDRRLAQMEAEGVRFENNTEIGVDISARYLLKSFDAILIAVGAGQPRDLEVEGRPLKGVHFAMEYLTQSNLVVDGLRAREQCIRADGKTVLVLGGGDTGSDCVGTAIRQGAKKVYQFEILPQPPEWKESWNPDWPHWPNILRTSSSQREGCERQWNILTRKFEGRNGRVYRAHFSRIEWSGQPPVYKEIPGSAFSLQVDLVLLALGFLHIQHGPLIKDLELALDERGNILTNGDYATSRPGVFAAGDASAGASLVVRAIFQGRRAAEKIDTYLK